MYGKITILFNIIESEPFVAHFFVGLYMKINKILEETIPGLGFELVDVEITPAKIIRVFVDKDGGISVEDCAEISNHLSKVFLVEEVDYNRLEISSPGLERPLKKLEDYVRFVGRLAKIKTHDAIDNNKSFQGHIESVENKIINLKLENGNLFSVEFEDIGRGRLIYEPKKQESKKK